MPGDTNDESRLSESSVWIDKENIEILIEQCAHDDIDKKNSAVASLNSIITLLSNPKNISDSEKQDYKSILSPATYDALINNDQKAIFWNLAKALNINFNANTEPPRRSFWQVMTTNERHSEYRNKWHEQENAGLSDEQIQNWPYLQSKYKEFQIANINSNEKLTPVQKKYEQLKINKGIKGFSLSYYVSALWSTPWTAPWAKVAPVESSYDKLSQDKKSESTPPTADSSRKISLDLNPNSVSSRTVSVNSDGVTTVDSLSRSSTPTDNSNNSSRTNSVSTATTIGISPSPSPTLDFDSTRKTTASPMLNLIIKQNQSQRPTNFLQRAQQANAEREAKAKQGELKRKEKAVISDSPTTVVSELSTPPEL